mmetsp:Transcript_13677/g.32176  ORF Transcript_13677/g.32176 Transcript_13677/m.32176 type:complete len:665 (-) Transcript_13677:53-2047(-)
MASSPASASDAPVASVAAIRRLHRDYEKMQKSPNPQIEVRPSDNMLVWHFVLHNLPQDCPYHEGCYHGMINFPQEYPHKPPSLRMVTPSGRLQVNTSLCLSMTEFHPESWNPAWSVETILVGLLSFFISDKEAGYGSVKKSEEVRKQLAAQSWETNAQDSTFRELFPEFLTRPAVAAGAQAEGTGESSTAHTSDHDSDGNGRPDNASPEESSDASREVASAGGADATRSLAVAPLHAAPEETQEEAEEAREDSEVEECWICRDTTLDEPLVRPCACRGSMSGVHASCVEQWIAHHRQTALNNDPPRCAVCGEEYRGQDQAPGLLSFGKYVCGKALLILRTMVILQILLLYYAAWGTEKEMMIKMPLPYKIGLMVLFSLIFLQKIFILVVTLHNRPGPAPQNCLLRQFYEDGQTKFTIHVAEVWTMIMMMTMWVIKGTLSLWCWLPYFVLFLVPLLQLFSFVGAQRLNVQCFVRIIKAISIVIVAIIAAPFLLIVGVAVLIYQNPWRVVHPLDAAWHLYIAFAAILLCTLCQSNIPLLALWSVHSALCLLGLVEQLLLRKLRWYGGRVWCVALYATFAAALVANDDDLKFSRGLVFQGSRIIPVRQASWVWVAIVTALTLRTNWSGIHWLYQNWQQRHGRFTLNRDVAGNAGAENGESGRAVLPV